MESNVISEAYDSNLNQIGRCSNQNIKCPAV
ncbi:hypothetical protein EV561_102540 [Rhizobium sp. BK376]|nr:hypothetical protein EV561_102540 [Rhizobium sp. BK376]